ncbi:MAG: hypothetical protein GF375_02720 [Candidatus Omnitrophica bacterium]|nr:hypothetical protein [Candidatus Omnitrophota bacterium]MBD3269012.1 hypothetical protein [Candidatus Omnitrophota bacterium]
MLHSEFEIIEIGGLKLIFSPLKNIHTASVGLFLKIGSRYEKKSLKGIAHFLEHMVFKGSKKYSHRKIKREIEGRGGSLNGFTSQEITAFYAHFLKKNCLLTLDILLDMVFAPLLDKREIDKERKVVLEEIKMYNDLPASRASILLDSLLWPKHPLGEEVIGCENTVKAINRKNLNDFHGRYYKPSNMVISCSGHLSKSEIISLIERKARDILPKKINLRQAKPKPLRGARIKTENKGLEQSHFCLGFRSVSYKSPDILKSHLLNIILGANMSSRLFEELREKRSLCYDVSTEIKRYKDSGAFVIHVGLDRKNILTALRSIIKEIEKILSKPVYYKELIRAKDYFLGQIAMSLERPQGRMFNFAESFITRGEIYSFETIKKKVDKITAGDINRFCSRIFKLNNICISCVGNIDKTIDQKIKDIIY